MVLADPAVEVLALTIAAGNACLPNVVDNAARILTILGKTHIPMCVVVRGPRRTRLDEDAFSNCRGPPPVMQAQLGLCSSLRTLLPTITAAMVSGVAPGKSPLPRVPLFRASLLPWHWWISAESTQQDLLQTMDLFLRVARSFKQSSKNSKALR